MKIGIVVGWLVNPPSGCCAAAWSAGLCQWAEDRLKPVPPLVEIPPGLHEAASGRTDQPGEFSLW